MELSEPVELPLPDGPVGRPINFQADFGKARIVVVDMVHHQPPDESPTTVEARFSRFLTMDEQPFIRRAKAGEDWKPLETGWLEQAGMVVVRNEEGQFATNPTPEERAAVKARVLEITFGGADAGDGKRTASANILVLPGESARFHPAALKSILVRCRKGTARFTVHVFPA